MSPPYAPLFPVVEPLIVAAQPTGSRPVISNGWATYHSPFREDKHPSFSCRPDSESDPGAFKDHATGQHGSMADLARLFGVGPHFSSNGQSGPGSRGTRPSLAQFCAERQLDAAHMCSAFKVRETTHMERPALVYATPLGQRRAKFLDGERPKYIWVDRGGKRHWYGLDQALPLGGDTLYLVNGEVSVWACIQAGVPAVCLCSGEGNLPTPELVADLKDAMARTGIARVRVVYDRGEAHDVPGRGSRAIAAMLHGAGLDAEALDLPDTLGTHGDVDDLHRLVGDDGLAAALADLPILVFSFSSSEKTRKREFTLTRVGDMYAEPEEVQSWVCGEMLPVGGSSICAAKPKVGKTTLALNLSVNVSRGYDFMGRRTTSGAVVYLALEEKRAEVVRRFKAMGVTDERIFVHTGSAPEDALAALKGAIEEHTPVLVVIDPLMRFIRLRDVNDYAQVNLAMEPIHSLARTSGAHILCVHHAGKGERTGGDVVLGSTALFAAVDTLLVMRTRDAGRTVQSIQRYGEDLPETVVTLDPETGIVAAAGDVATVQTEQIAGAILSAVADDALTESEIKDRVDKDTRLLPKALRELVKAGTLDRTGDGKKGAPYRYALAEETPKSSFSAFSRFSTIEKREKAENEQQGRGAGDTDLLPCSGGCGRLTSHGWTCRECRTRQGGAQ